MTTPNPEFSSAPHEHGTTRELFEEIDQNSSGTISTEEIQTAFGEKLHVAMSEDMAQAMIDAVDYNHSGEVTYKEFKRAFGKGQYDGVEDVMKQWAVRSGVHVAMQLYFDANIDINSPSYSHLFLAGGIGGVISRTCTAPLDRVRIIQQTSARASGQGMRSLLSSLYAEGGWKGLFAGNAANCLKVFPNAAIVCATYGLMQKLLLPPEGALDARRLYPAERLAAGAAAGGFATLATYPLEVIRTNLAVQGYVPVKPRVPALGTARRAATNAATTTTNNAGTAGTTQLHKLAMFSTEASAARSFTSMTRAYAKLATGAAHELQMQYRGISGCTRSIWQRHGWQGFFRGVQPSLVALAGFVAVQQAGYDMIFELQQRRFEWDPTPQASLMAGAVTGVLAQTIVHPIDTVRRRMQVLSHNRKMSSVSQTVSHVVRRSGVRGLYAGLAATYVKVVPSVAVALCVRDAVLGRLQLKPL